MRGRHTLAAVGGTLCLLLASGCGGSAEPQPLPRPTASFDPSESPSPTPPAMPSAAKEKTKAGAIDFARHYVALINYTQATGSTAELAEAETEDCGTCDQSREAIEKLYASGAVVRGGDWQIASLNALPNPATKGWLVEAAVSFGPQQVDRPGDDQDQALKGGRLPVNMQLVWQDGEWKVAECTRGA